MEEGYSQQRKRLIFLFAGLIDSLLGGAVLLIYFGLLPLDLSGYGIPRWVVGVAGGLWFLSGFVVVMVQLAQPRLDE